MSDSKNDVALPASKVEEPVAASKEQDAPQDHSYDPRQRVIAHLNNGDTQAAFRALMTDENGRELDYAESRMRWG